MHCSLADHTHLFRTTSTNKGLFHCLLTQNVPGSVLSFPLWDAAMDLILSAHSQAHSDIQWGIYQILECCVIVIVHNEDG